MRNPMPFKDTVTLHNVTFNEYAKPILGDGEECLAAFEQGTSYRHGAYQDSVEGDDMLYLKPNAFLASVAYRTEGMIAQINLFGGEADKQWFRITDSEVIRDTLLDNQIYHIECRVKKVTDFNPEVVS